MQIFVYEFITGGGMFSVNPREAPSGSLLREGDAMLNSLVEDFSKIPDTQVVVLRDVRLASLNRIEIASHAVSCEEDELQQFDSLVASADWTVVIAPEFDRILLNRTRQVEKLGGRLLGPCSPVVQLGTNKNDTMTHLVKHGIPVPNGCRYEAGSSIPDDIRFPAVLKPNDGAGSQHIIRVERRESVPEKIAGLFRLEEFQDGTPASVAILSGPSSKIALPACQQLLTADGSFQYLGGQVPLDEPQRNRAEQLALKTAHALPDFIGYIGIDLVIGSSEEKDTVIEVNPRMTTSYVGLRALARCNLAAAMLDLASGETPAIPFDADPVRFSSDGTVY